MLRFADPIVPIVHAPWHAQLALDYERRDNRTVLARRRHDGPLVVQKPLYPEGDEVCHGIVVHPPAGIAGGDELELLARLHGGSRALLTTPGAGKWYRSAGPWARQRIGFDVAAGASLEWLPQETIFFDGALAELSTDIRLSGDACFIGWDIVCLGRVGSGERFVNGECRLRTTVTRDGKVLWLERARFSGSDVALESMAVMAGQPVAGTFVVASPKLSAAILNECREPRAATGEVAVTLLPGVFVGRYLGLSGEAAKEYFTRLWQILRPIVVGRAAQPPRIWRT